MAKFDVNISGAVLIGYRQAMEDLVGSNVVKRALDELGNDVKEQYLAITPFTWCPVEIVDAITTNVAKCARRDLHVFNSEVTRLNLQRTFSTLWRLLLRVTSDASLMSRTPVVYSKTYDRGVLVSNVLSPGRAEVIVRGWPEMPALHMDGLRVGVSTVLEIAGRKDVKVVSNRRADGAGYLAVWRP